MSRHHLYLLALSLALTGMALFLYKALVLGFPLTPHRISDIWNLEARIAFVARNEPAKVSLFIPRPTRHFAIVNENFISQGYGITTGTEDGDRQAVWSKRKAKGQQTIYYRAVVRHVGTKKPGPVSRPPEIEYPRFEGPYLVAAQSLISDIRAQSADVETLVRELIKRLNRPQPDDNTALLLGKGASVSKKVKIAVRVLAEAGIPARVIHGVRLEEENQNAPLLHWLEVYDNCLLYTSPSPRDATLSRMPSSA